MFDKIMKSFILKHISQLMTLTWVNEIYTKEQENIPFGRIETQAARQVMLQKLERLKEKVVAQFKTKQSVS